MGRAMSEVSAAEISRNFGVWQDKAMSSPVVVTRHGKQRLVLMSADIFNANQYGVADEAVAVPDIQQAQRALLSHMIEAFVAFDEGLRITAVNRAFENITNLGAADLIGHTLEEALPRSQPLFIDFLRRALKTGDAMELEFSSALSPGRVYRSRAFPYLGGVAAVLQSRQDDYDKEQLSSRLQAQVAAAEHLTGVYWASLSLRGTLTEVTENFGGLIGLARKDLEHKALVQLVKPAWRSAVGLAMELCIGGRETRSVEAVLFTEGMTERRVTIVFAPVLEAHAVVGLKVAVAVAA